jgi:hypothetical protein
VSFIRERPSPARTQRDAHLHHTPGKGDLALAHQPSGAALRPLHPLSADVGIVVNDNDEYMACFSDPTLQLIIVIVLPSAFRHNTVVLTSARPHHSRITFLRTDEVIK